LYHFDENIVLEQFWYCFFTKKELSYEGIFIVRRATKITILAGRSTTHLRLHTISGGGARMGLESYRFGIAFLIIKYGDPHANNLKSKARHIKVSANKEER